jgi:hypothetical protein
MDILKVMTVISLLRCSVSPVYEASRSSVSVHNRSLGA